MYQIDFHTPIQIYFIGIGGISMSGLAEILLKEGFSISGSDRTSSPLTDSLTKKGAHICYGQQAENIHNEIDLIVYTAAIAKENPELQKATHLGIPLLTRAQLLGQMMKNYKTPIAISGTHGKTTTTSMLSQILLAADTDPTLSIGGIYRPIGGNIRIGDSEYFVTEACEYTDSFLSFFPKISIILNIEEDHMDYFKDIHHIRKSFQNFAHLLPKDGFLIINTEIDDYQEITSGLIGSVITYGSSPDSDYSFTNLTYDEYARPTFELLKKGISYGYITLGVTGKHNVLNALSAIALANLLNLPFDTVKKALLSFQGTDRRFEWKGSLGGITILDDYAHHPTEITATLETAQNYPHNTIWCVFQPHTYTRTKAFLNDFASSLALADKVVLSDIFAARETDTLGISSADLQKKIQDLGKECFYFRSFDEIENFLLEHCINGDLLITMGAGDIVKVGESLLGL